MELYKSKTNLEVDKKVTLLETKSRQEARQLKLENEQLKEMLSFKEGKNKELTQEIGRLKIVIRAETEMGKGAIKSEDQFDPKRSIVTPSRLEQRYHKFSKFAASKKLPLKEGLNTE